MRSAVWVKVVAAIVLIVFSIGTFVTSGQLDVTWLQYFSAAVFVATGVLTLWELFLWRLPPSQTIPGTPISLRGTWQGEAITLWLDPDTSAQVPPVRVYLVVRQTATDVTVTLLTAESTSKSTLARVSPREGTSVLEYLYFNRPRAAVQHRSRTHYGATTLDVAGSPAHRMTGSYWTDRDTRGELRFDTRNPKLLADDFDEATAGFANDTFLLTGDDS